MKKSLSMLTKAVHGKSTAISIEDEITLLQTVTNDTDPCQENCQVLFSLLS